MNLTPLAQEREVELVVNEIGYVVLLHKGTLNYQFAWAEYDHSNASLYFVTPEGEMQPLGMKIHESFEQPLCRTKELTLVEVGSNMSCQNITFIKFAKKMG